MMNVGKRFYATYNAGLVEGFCGAIGNTPLLKLNSLSAKTGCNILAKAEFMNPGGSVKDRAALYIIRDAEERDLITKGGTVVEGTAGNTGIGLAHICKARGYSCVIFMPDTQSKEKIDLLRNLGADVRPVPAVPYDNPQNYNHQAKRYAESLFENWCGLKNAVWTNQFDNVANRHGHFLSTGPEIWEQTNGSIDAFTCATGTGGTLAGVALFLKQKRSSIKCVLADPPGSVLFNKFGRLGCGELKRHGLGSITEGIGQGRVTSNLEGAPLDDALCIEDEKTIRMVFDIFNDEGLFLGASSSLNLCAAVEVAKSMKKGSTIVTIACDGAYRYQSRLFSRKWLESKGLFQYLDKKHHSQLVE